MFKIILHVTRPNTVVLGNIPGTRIFRSLSHYENVTRVPSFLILSIESPIFFANSLYLQERYVISLSRTVFIYQPSDLQVGHSHFVSEDCPRLFGCRISRWVRDEEKRIRENNDSALKCVILDMTGIYTNIYPHPISSVK